MQNRSSQFTSGAGTFGYPLVTTDAYGNIGAIQGRPFDPMPAFMRASLALRQVTPCGIMFLGSSTIQGNNATQPYNQFTHILTGMMQRAYPNGINQDESTIQNIASSPVKQTVAGVHGYYSGIGGTTSANYLTSALVTTITNMAPAVRFHMVTTNDYRNQVNPATTQANLQSWLNQLRAAQTVNAIDIYVLPYAPFDGPGTYGAYTTYPQSAYGQAMQALCNDPQNLGRAYFMDISDAYAPLCVPPNANGSDLLGLIDTDHIHQVDKGHRYMAETFKQRLAIGAEDTAIVQLPLGGTVRTGETPAKSIVTTRSS